MSNSDKTNEESLEWLKLKTDKGQTPDFVKKFEKENVGNKFVRKFKENPLVPVGKSFYDKSTVKKIHYIDLKKKTETTRAVYGRVINL